MASQIIVQYNSSVPVCTLKHSRAYKKETFVLIYLELNQSLLQFVISILGTHVACELINPYCAIATFINLSLVLLKNYKNCQCLVLQSGHGMEWNGRQFFHIPYWQFSSIPYLKSSIPYKIFFHIPFHTKIFFYIPFHTSIPKKF